MSVSLPSTISCADPFELVLRQLMRRALMATAVTSTMLGSAACHLGNPSKSGASDPSRTDGEVDSGPPAVSPDAGGDGSVVPLEPGGPAVSCESGVGFPVRASGLKIEPVVDYLAIREVRVFDTSGESDEWIEKEFSVVSERGESCKTATGTACADKVKRHPARAVISLPGQVSLEYSVVTTTGNDVKRWAGAEELKALLGSIDSADDAMLIVSAAGYMLHCNAAVSTSVVEEDDGYIVYATRMTSDCDPVTMTRYRLHVSRAAEIKVLKTETLSQQFGLCVGRKPGGLQLRETGNDSLGGFLARCAHLEGASVFSFERLAAELEANGAPRALVERAHAAREDEIRHAHVVGKLALARGGRLEEVHLAPMTERSLEEIAIENAIEGCVRETYGALIGGYQAEHARDLTLQDAMASIADDELKHAALSHAVHAWLGSKLDSNARERVARAQQEAIAQLWADAACEPDRDVADLAGLPTAKDAGRLLGELSRGLWEPMLRAA